MSGDSGMEAVVNKAVKITGEILQKKRVSHEMVIPRFIDIGAQTGLSLGMPSGKEQT